MYDTIRYFGVVCSRSHLDVPKSICMIKGKEIYLQKLIENRQTLFFFFSQLIF